MAVPRRSISRDCASRSRCSSARVATGRQSCTRTSSAARTRSSWTCRSAKIVSALSSEPRARRCARRGLGRGLGRGRGGGGGRGGAALCKCTHALRHCRPAPLPPCAAPDGDEAHGLHVLRQRERHPGPRRAHQALCAAPPPLTPAPVPRVVPCPAETPDALSPRRFFTASPLRHFVSSPLCHFAPSPLCLFASPLRVHTRSR